MFGFGKNKLDKMLDSGASPDELFEQILNEARDLTCEIQTDFTKRQVCLPVAGFALCTLWYRFEQTNPELAQSIKNKVKPAMKEFSEKHKEIDWGTL